MFSGLGKKLGGIFNKGKKKSKKQSSQEGQEEGESSGLQIPGLSGGDGGGISIPGLSSSGDGGLQIPGVGGEIQIPETVQKVAAQVLKSGVAQQVVKQVATTMFSKFFGGGKSTRKTYKKGWSSSNSNKYGYKGSTVRDSGRGSAGTSYVTTGEARSWEEIRDECLESGELWVDPDFPAIDSSLYYDKPPQVRGEIEWKRPSEISGNPVMFDAEGASRLDVNQGVLGDCWLLAAVSCLATNNRLLHRVIPDDQNFNEGEYAGVFRFNIWQYGRWVEVLIDDLLPTVNGRLIYMHSDNKSEYWSALMEKAYAKLHGNYEALSGGLTSEALTDFTGGVVERFQMRENAPDDLLPRMLRAFKRYSLMGCSIDASPDQMEAQLDNGLIIGHAYSITDVRMVETESYGQIPMVRVRNPWGDSHEWKGAWGDESEEWQNISEEERESMGLTFEDDGEFWMAFDDFKTEFQRLEICYLGPDTLEAGDDGDVADSCRKWEGRLMEGAWKRNVNAGGCANFPRTFHTNPQYRIHIEEPDEDDEDGKTTIIVGLMQKDRRKMRSEGKHDLTIGYAIYELDDPDCGTLGSRYFSSHRSVGRSTAFINIRESSGHHCLAAGDYVIVPSTFDANEEGDFILRVYSEKQNDTNELDEETGVVEPEDESVGEDTDEDRGSRDQASESFLRLAGEDGEIDAWEIADIFNTVFMREFQFDGFSTDMCRGMVAMYDADISGKLGYDDFKNLWTEMQICKKIFQKLDLDGSGYFQSHEYREALRYVGLRISNSTFSAIVKRYSNKEGQVRFDDFVASYTKLKSMFESFKDKDPSSDGSATFELDEFIQMTMYS